MPAYMITNVWFRDREKAQEYNRQVTATLDKYGGRYLARGGRVEPVEGNWPRGYVSILEFPSVEQARRWYESEEYSKIKPIRLQNADSEIVVVEGLAGDR